MPSNSPEKLCKFTGLPCEYASYQRAIDSLGGCVGPTDVIHFTGVKYDSKCGRNPLDLVAERHGFTENVCGATIVKGLAFGALEDAINERELGRKIGSVTFPVGKRESILRRFLESLAKDLPEDSPVEAIMAMPSQEALDQGIEPKMIPYFVRPDLQHLNQ